MCCQERRQGALAQQQNQLTEGDASTATRKISRADYVQEARRGRVRRASVDCGFGFDRAAEADANIRMIYIVIVMVIEKMITLHSATISVASAAIAGGSASRNGSS